MSELTPPLFFLRRPEVEARVGLSRSSIYAFMAAGDFPKAISAFTSVELAHVRVDFFHFHIHSLRSVKLIGWAG